MRHAGRSKVRARQAASKNTASPVFRALSDPTRRQILQALQDDELSAGDIGSRFPITGPSVSRHLSVLKAAGLAQKRREANRIMYSLVPSRLAGCLTDFLSAVCPGRLVLEHHRTPDKAHAEDADP